MDQVMQIVSRLSEKLESAASDVELINAVQEAKFDMDLIVEQAYEKNEKG